MPGDLIPLDSTSQVFPVFVARFMPQLLGGVVLGTLFITVVGGGSGLALGMASILVTDLFARKSSRMKQSRTNLLVTRGTILVILMAAAVVAILVPGAMINDFGFLSMGLRGAVVFLPMCGGLWLKGRFPGGLPWPPFSPAPSRCWRGTLWTCLLIRFSWGWRSA